MLLGALWLLVAAVATIAGSAALGRGLSELAARRGMSVAPVRSLVIGVVAAAALPGGATPPEWSWAPATRPDPPRPDQPPEPGPGGQAGAADDASSTSRGVLRSAAGIGLLAGGALALVEGTLRVAIRAPLGPGFAG